MTCSDPPSEAPPPKGSAACWSSTVSGTKCLEACAWCVLAVGHTSPSDHKEFLGQSWTWLKIQSCPAFVEKWQWDVDPARGRSHRVEHLQKHLGEGASVPSLSFLCRWACSPSTLAHSPLSLWCHSVPGSGMASLMPYGVLVSVLTFCSLFSLCGLFHVV